MVTKATPKEAPLVTPNTEGLASGFLNNNCIQKPARARPAPANKDIRPRGNLNSQNMADDQFSNSQDHPAEPYSRDNTNKSTATKLEASSLIKMVLEEMFCIEVTKLIKKVVQRLEDYDFCALFIF
jgi:hypothetical protein